MMQPCLPTAGTETKEQPYPQRAMASRFFEVKKGQIRLGLMTFKKGDRLWLSDAEYEHHKDNVVLIYPPEGSHATE